jgi:hypothetical protein
MLIRDARPVSGQVSTGSPLALTLDGNWPQAVVVKVDGARVALQHSPSAIEFEVPAGQHRVLITPR